MMSREQYLLQCLAEELGEVGKDLLKGARFGLLCDWYEGQTNLARANIEWSQVSALMTLLEIEYGHKFEVSELEVQKKINTFEQFYDHSVANGMVEPRNAQEACDCICNLGRVSVKSFAHQPDCPRAAS